MKNLVVSLLLISFPFVAFAGETITGCWVADAGGKTAHWVDPCPGGLFGDKPQAAPPTPQPNKFSVGGGDPMKGLNIHQSDGDGCGVANPPPNGNTANWVKPCPSGSFREATPPVAPPTPQPNKLSVGSGDPLKGLNVSSGNGCWVANPPPNGNTANWVKPCPKR